VLDRIRSLLAENGAEVRMLSDPPASFAVSSPRGKAAEEDRLIREAIDEFYRSVAAS
jgi:hypothetical protein